MFLKTTGRQRMAWLQQLQHQSYRIAARAYNAFPLSKSIIQSRVKPCLPYLWTLGMSAALLSTAACDTSSPKPVPVPEPKPHKDYEYIKQVPSYPVTTFGYTYSTPTSGNIIFVGDVHGCYDELMALLEKVSFNKEKDVLVLLGDLVGKGPKSIDVVRFAISLGPACIALRGNHEQFVIDYRRYLRDHHTDTTRAPIKSHTHREVAEQLSPEEEAFLFSMPFWVHFPEIDVLAVHAGVLPHLPVWANDASMLLNMRSVRRESLGPAADLDPLVFLTAPPNDRDSNSNKDKEKEKEKVNDKANDGNGSGKQGSATNANGHKDSRAAAASRPALTPAQQLHAQQHQKGHSLTAAELAPPAAAPLAPADDLEPSRRLQDGPLWGAVYSAYALAFPHAALDMRAQTQQALAAAGAEASRVVSAPQQGQSDAKPRVSTGAAAPHVQLLPHSRLPRAVIPGHRAPHVLFGHDAASGLQTYPAATGLDTGCCYGNRLSALVFDNLVSVHADRVRAAGIAEETVPPAEAPRKSVVGERGRCQHWLRPLLVSVEAMQQYVPIEPK